MSFAPFDYVIRVAKGQYERATLMDVVPSVSGWNGEMDWAVVFLNEYAILDSKIIWLITASNFEQIGTHPPAKPPSDHPQFRIWTAE